MDKLEAQRRRRLRAELLDECRLTVPVPVLEELVYARYIRAHEGKVPTYGAVVVTEPGGNKISAVVRQGELILAQAPNRSAIPRLRPYADGVHTFVVRDTNKAYLALGLRIPMNPPVESAHEVELARLAREVGAVLRRTGDGTITILLADGVIRNRGAIWTTMQMDLSSFPQLGSETLPQLSTGMNTKQSVLELCMHVLSPSGIGATLVLHDSESLDGVGGIGWSGPADPPPLSVNKLQHHPVLAHVLAQYDGATFLAPDGRLIALGAFFKLRPGSVRAQPPEWGTRHRSAGAFSRQHRGLDVIVVSADGAVTTFRGGEPILVARRRGEPHSFDK